MEGPIAKRTCAACDRRIRSLNHVRLSIGFSWNRLELYWKIYLSTNKNPDFSLFSALFFFFLLLLRLPVSLFISWSAMRRMLSLSSDERERPKMCSSFLKMTCIAYENGSLCFFKLQVLLLNFFFYIIFCNINKINISSYKNKFFDIYGIKHIF